MANDQASLKFSDKIKTDLAYKIVSENAAVVSYPVKMMERLHIEDSRRNWKQIRSIADLEKQDNCYQRSIMMLQELLIDDQKYFFQTGVINREYCNMFSGLEITDTYRISKVIECVKTARKKAEIGSNLELRKNFLDYLRRNYPKKVFISGNDLNDIIGLARLRPKALTMMAKNARIGILGRNYILRCEDLMNISSLSEKTDPFVIVTV